MFRFLVCVFLFFPALAQASTSLDQQVALEYQAKGQAAQMRGDLTQAQFLYERAEALLPNDAGLLNDIGLVDEALGRINEAEAHYLKAIASDFKCLPAYSNLGYLYENQEKFDLAAQYFEKRVKLGSPQDPYTLQAQAELDHVILFSRSLKQKKKTVEAKALENAMVLRSREQVVPSLRARIIKAEVDYQRGLRLFQERHYDAARRAFEMCLAFSGGHKGAAHMLDRLKAMRNSPRIVKEVVSGGQKDHAIAMAEYDKGLRLLQDGYRDEAVKAFDRALVFAPSDRDIEAARQKALEK